MDMTEGLKAAIKAAKGQSALGRLLGLRQSVISNWLMREKRIPAERVLAVERVTGIPRERLRPDLYPDPQNDKTLRVEGLDVPSEPA